MKLSKRSWTVQVSKIGFSAKPAWKGVMWSGFIFILNETEFRTEKGCKRNFERFAKDNGIKDFKYV